MTGHLWDHGKRGVETVAMDAYGRAMVGRRMAPKARAEVKSKKGFFLGTLP